MTVFAIVKDAKSGRPWCAVFTGQNQEAQASAWESRGWLVKRTEPNPLPAAPAQAHPDRCAN